MTMQLVMPMRQVHCARGPERCARCRESAGVMRWQLVDIDPPEQDKTARPTLMLTINGETCWRVYDVVRSFANEQEARAYAAQHDLGIYGIGSYAELSVNP